MSIIDDKLNEGYEIVFKKHQEDGVIKNDDLDYILFLQYWQHYTSFDVYKKDFGGGYSMKKKYDGNYTLDIFFEENIVLSFFLHHTRPYIGSYFMKKTYDEKYAEQCHFYIKMFS
jgi:hypothetical protein